MEVTLPADGEYRLRLGDTQQAGGGAYGYRLRIGPPRPDFELRVVPSTVNARAGATVPLTVYALRKDGFCEDITLELKDPPGGFTLSGGWVPAGQDQVRLTLTVPSAPAQERVRLGLEGRAMIDGREVRRPAVPAEDMTQAFVYRHVVPADDLMVAITGRRWARGSPKLLVDGPVKLPAGGTAQVRLMAPGAALWGEFQLELSDPPDGIAIQDVLRGPQGVAILLRAESEKLQPGLKGNLIVDAFVEREFPRPDGTKSNKRRIPVGTLPAIPFEIVPRQ